MRKAKVNHHFGSLVCGATALFSGIFQCWTIFPIFKTPPTAAQLAVNVSNSSDVKTFITKKEQRLRTKNKEIRVNVERVDFRALHTSHTSSH